MLYCASASSALGTTRFSGEPSAASETKVTSAVGVSLRQEGGFHATAAAKCPQELEARYAWPVVSFARMRAGLRSALKTECSGFKFQNGGRSLRWFRSRRYDDDRDDPTCTDDDCARLFWQGHAILYEQHWDVLKPRNYFILWRELARLDGAYRERYSERDPTARGADRLHAQVMQADNNVERALRWALDRRSGLSTMLVSEGSKKEKRLLLALSLEGGWTWLLERWQAMVESQFGTSEWRTRIAAAAIETGSLSMVQEHWPHIEARRRIGNTIGKAIGRSGSTEVLDWLVDNGIARDLTIDSGPYFLLAAASEYGHVSLMEQAAARIPAVRYELDQYDDSFLQRACWGGHLRTVEWLVSRGALLAPCAVESAARYGHHSLVCYLCEMSGMSGAFRSHDTVSTLLCRSTPDCLAVLEYAMRHLHCTPSPSDIVRAATTANVRPDVLHFLSAHSTQEVWEAALADDNVRSDLDVRDLLHTAAATPGNEKG